MKHLILLPLLALTACATPVATCDNAAKVRAAAALALQALERACPLGTAR